MTENLSNILCCFRTVNALDQEKKEYSTKFVAEVERSMILLERGFGNILK